MIVKNASLRSHSAFYTTYPNILCHLDGGVNAFIFTKREYFWAYTSTVIPVWQVGGSTINSSGIGIVRIRLNNQVIISLYPCYHIATNPQNTFSPTALEKYNHYKSARIEALGWFIIVTPSGKVVHVLSDPIKILSECLDYIKLDIITTSFSISPNTSHHSPTPSPEPSPHLHPLLACPQINNAFCHNNKNLDYLLVHRQLSHSSNSKLMLMCKRNILTDLPQLPGADIVLLVCNCWICWKDSLSATPKGMTMNTDSLIPGELIYIDFFFVDVVSIRGFSAVLVVVDAKTRRLWKFCTPSKRPPLEILRFFLIQLKTAGRPVQKIRTDLGGELAKCSKVCKLLHSDFNVSYKLQEDIPSG